jgi:hypothetical protein
MPFPKGHKFGNRFKKGQSGNPSGRPKATRREIEALAFMNIGRFMKRDKDGEIVLDENGQPQIDYRLLREEDWAGVVEITQDKTGGSGDGERRAVLRTKLKLLDKGLNLERLGRHHKLFTDKVEVGADDSLLEIIEEARKRAGK